MRKEILMVLALAVLSLLVIGCSKESAQPTGGVVVDTISEEATSKTVTQPETVVVTEPEYTSSNIVETSSTETAEGVKEFAITAKSWEFLPSEIRVNKGDKVKLTVTSADVAHGFALAEFGIKETIQSGETKTIEFVADMKGTFIYFCSVPCGAGHIKMKGKFVVE